MSQTLLTQTTRDGTLLSLTASDGTKYSALVVQAGSEEKVLQGGQGTLELCVRYRRLGPWTRQRPGGATEVMDSCSTCKQEMTEHEIVQDANAQGSTVGGLYRMGGPICKKCRERTEA